MLRIPDITVKSSGFLRFTLKRQLAFHMKKLLFTAFYLIFLTNYLFGQGEPDEQVQVIFKSELTVGASLSTDGFGLSYREGKRLDFFNRRLLEFEISTLKHPKEIKLSNPFYQTPGSFVFGKENSVILFRGGIGHQKEIYEKGDQGGVAIRYFYTGGPVIAFYKPIYYKILRFVGSYEAEIIEEKFDITKHDPTMFYSKSSYFKGISEGKFMPGLFGKAGFNFEYSKQEKIIHAIELGAQINIFPKKIPIMAAAANKAVFFSLFASYRFGMIIDPLNPESNKLSNIFRPAR